jgi:hypothetical protein
MIYGIIDKEEIDTFIKEFNLFENYNNDFEINYLLSKNEDSPLINHTAKVSFDCLKVYKDSKHDILVLWKVSDKLQNEFKILKKYLLTGVFAFLDIQINRNNLNKWKNTELKKLKGYVKERYPYDVHTLQVKYGKEDLYPRIKTTFKCNHGSISKWKISNDIQEYAQKELGFSDKIKFDW